MTDLALREGVSDRATRLYAGRAFAGESLDPMLLPGLSARQDARVCAPLPRVEGASPDNPQYLIVDIAGHQRGSAKVPSRVHLYHMGESTYRIVGLERPDDDRDPVLN